MPVTARNEIPGADRELRRNFGEIDFAAARSTGYRIGLYCSGTPCLDGKCVPAANRGNRIHIIPVLEQQSRTDTKGPEHKEIEVRVPRDQFHTAVIRNSIAGEALD